MKLKLAPVISQSINAPDVLTKHGIESVKVRMLSVRHIGKIRDAGLMDLPAHVFERAKQIQVEGSLGTDAQNVQQAQRELAARKALHPSTGYHEPTVVRYGVVEVNSEPVTPEWWESNIDSLSQPAVQWLADEVCRFTGLNETEAARGNG